MACCWRKSSVGVLDLDERIEVVRVNDGGRRSDDRGRAIAAIDATVAVAVSSQRLLDVVEIEQHVVELRTWRSLRSFLVWRCGAIRMRRSS